MSRFILLPALSLLSACAFQHGDEPGSSTAALSGAVGFDTLSSSIFKPRCESCHSSGNASGGVDLSSYSSTMASGVVVAGDPSGSRLLSAVSSGAMPLGGSPLSEGDVASISGWIASGAPATVSVPAPTPAPSTNPQPAPSQSPATATFTWINANVLQPNCVSCHSGSSAPSGIDLSSYSSVMSSAVTAGNPSSSKLYTATSSGSMPPSGALPAADVTAIQSWIQAGAAND